jgi:hypothetical protein
MNMSKKQAEFFTVLILICTVTAAAILIIDYQIKGAILEESNRMRKELERYYGQRPAAASGRRPDSDTSHDLSYPSDLVGSGTTGVEEGGTNGSRPTPYPAPAVRRTRAARQTRPGSIPDTGK